MEALNRNQLIHTCQRALKKYGIENQLRQLQEECAELITAVNHYLRGRDSNCDELSEEIADVIIMVTQIQLGLDLYDKTTPIINAKRQKLATKLK